MSEGLPMQAVTMYPQQVWLKLDDDAGSMAEIRSEARRLSWKSGLNPFAKRVNSFQRRQAEGTRELDLEAGSRDQRPSNDHDQDFDRSQSTAVGSERGESLDHKSENPDLQYVASGAMTDGAAASNNGSLDDSQTRSRKLRFNRRKGTNGQISRSTTSSSRKSKTHKFTVWSQLNATIFNSYINILILAAPVGIALNFTNVNKIAVFVVNFIAIIPLAAMLSFATEEISLRVGETLGGLLNATFGNAVELIVSIIALVQKQVIIVQTSLIGSMLSNLLLVMGMCFFFGGINREEQFFNQTVASTATSLLALSVGSLIIPTAFHAWSGAGELGIAPISRGTAVILLVVYGCFLFFQLKSHTRMFSETGQKATKRNKDVESGVTRMSVAQAGGMLSAPAGGQAAQTAEKQEDEEEEQEEPRLAVWVAVLTLAVSTALVAVCAEFMVDSIDALTDTGHISKTFVGLILLPIVGNAAEHATAVTVACKDKMDLAIGVAVGSSIQIALLVLPFIVVLGWILHNDQMTFYFDPFQIIVLFVSILLVSYVIGDGKSHWMEGVLLQSTYLVIALAAWYYPSVHVT
ncbi:Calcium/proton exchanger [Xylona heveae TC161]|uniref:Calcium/proton exchanger n=1 Tax=Xylona heveae (strain CBS 132557 / TC161) TaxID=1328760 RepID=A0A165HCF3_XYLHT|nr:Calcium/proton exchanger [Xylona heveae TC161]KZF23294.1 Calcium/proton exchanger [Xylona heveae TC161]